MVNAQNNNWIEKKTLMSCLEQAKRQGVSWKYLAYVENGGAHLLARRERGAMFLFVVLIKFTPHLSITSS
jgi:hypothetical protein